MFRLLSLPLGDDAQPPVALSSPFSRRNPARSKFGDHRAGRAHRAAKVSATPPASARAGWGDAVRTGRLRWALDCAAWRPSPDEWRAALGVLRQMGRDGDGESKEDEAAARRRAARGARRGCSHGVAG
mgnify:CR=1 FL=1